MEHTRNTQPKLTRVTPKFEQLNASVVNALGNKKVKVYSGSTRICEFLVPVLRNTASVTFNDDTPKCRIVRTIEPLGWCLENATGSVKLEAQATHGGGVKVRGTQLGDLQMRVNRETRTVNLFIGDEQVGQFKTTVGQVYRFRVLVGVFAKLDQPTRTYLEAPLFYVFAQYPPSVTQAGNPSTVALISGKAVMFATIPAAVF